MIEFIPTVADYANDTATQKIWQWIEPHFAQDEGICFYKYPIIRTVSGEQPDLTLFTRSFQPLIVRCLHYRIGDIRRIDMDMIAVGGETYDSPLLELEDLAIVLKSKFDYDRVLRGCLMPVCILGLPLISKHEFEDKFGQLDLNGNTIVLFADGQANNMAQPLQKSLNESEWRHVRSIIQGINVLKNPSRHVPQEATTLADAIKILDRDIALLDKEQMKAALQIAPGPQRIRGLAGTGKTILLAMKAANIHLRFPDKKILFTFNTQSLYKQTRNLITKFYRAHNGGDPNWEQLHIRYAWGGVSRLGVYHEVCQRLHITPYSFTQARYYNPENPFQACCTQVLSHSIEPVYDFILFDEAQDFPKEFFQLLYKLSFPPHHIYWIYDELQNLAVIDIPQPEELFGQDENGKSQVSLCGESYPGNIEKDIALHKSYRCPQTVLMLAHAIGLGVYNPEGCVQMLEKTESWEALGYHIEEGKLATGEQIVIHRPPENSPNRIREIYQGSQDIVLSKVFANREEEIDWITQSIKHNIEMEHIAPEDIMVICLDYLRMKEFLPPLQRSLFDLDIASTITGIHEASTVFAEKGRVTLTNVFRAKGNEADIVYILSFESLYDYVNVIDNRNQAFTAISRSKAWVRITGVGVNMQKAQEEIKHILNDQPYFRFSFPDLKVIRRIDTETKDRWATLKKAEEAVLRISNLDLKVIDALAHQKPGLLDRMIQHLQEATTR